MRSIYLTMKSELIQLMSRSYARIKMRPLPHCCIVCCHSEYHKVAVKAFLKQRARRRRSSKKLASQICYRHSKLLGLMHSQLLGQQIDAATRSLGFPFLSPDRVPAGSRDVEDPNIADGDPIPDEVKVDLHMFGPLVLNRVGGEVHRTDVVAVDKSAPGERSVELGKELPKPRCLCHAVSDNAVLRLGTGAGDHRLTLG
uniref:Uncharacterized protein n=1 Tax=Setaria viridis TaxID=4556 RepID=A0A4U6TBP7_SETVI|nr:hypothetical protein SEVIR_9G299800v2 [Setaria viridis]